MQASQGEVVLVNDIESIYIYIHYRMRVGDGTKKLQLLLLGCPFLLPRNHDFSFSLTLSPKFVWLTGSLNRKENEVLML
jgi:hypothetical protein